MVILGCEFSFITGNGNSVIDGNGRITGAIDADWEAIDGIGVSGRIMEPIGGGDTMAIGGNGLGANGTMEYTRFNIFLPVVLSFPIFK